MPYVKGVWVDNVSPLSAARLNKLETQYDEVKTELAKTGTSDIRVHAKNIDNDGDGSGLAADIYGGLRWVKPGDTIYLIDSADKASNTNNTQWFVKAGYSLPRPGKYRVTGTAKASMSEGNGGTLYFALPGHNGNFIPITNSFSVSTLTLTNFTLDFICPVPPGAMVILVMKSDDSSGGYGITVTELNFKYADGIPSMSPSVVIPV